MFFLDYNPKCRNVGLRHCWKCIFWQRQLMTKAMGLFVLQGGFCFAFKLTDCSYRFERGNTSWHAIIVLFPYGKWLKVPCLCCYLFISSRDKYWSYAVANNLLLHCLTEYWFPCDTQNEVGKAACLFVKRSCRRCGSLGNINNISSQMVNKKKMCYKIFAERAEYWILKCTEKHRHNTKVKLQMNFWTGTTEFSDTVFRHWFMV